MSGEKKGRTAAACLRAPRSSVCLSPTCQTCGGRGYRVKEWGPFSLILLCQLLASAESAVKYFSFSWKCYILLENQPLSNFKANFNSQLLNKKWNIIQPIFYWHLTCGKDYTRSEDTELRHSPYLKRMHLLLVNEGNLIQTFLSIKRRICWLVTKLWESRKVLITSGSVEAIDSSSFGFPSLLKPWTWLSAPLRSCWSPSCCAQCRMKGISLDRLGLGAMCPLLGHINF